MNIIYYLLLFFIYSILGFIVESIYTFIMNRKFLNRGFLIGPYLPIYGFGCLLLIILLKDSIKDPISLFFKSIIICSILEYFTSYIMEKIFKTRWWDYSNRKFNINGRICLETMIPFGILGCLVMYVINPFIVNIILTIDIKLIYIISFILLFIFIIDFTISFKIIFNIRGIIKNVAKDSTDEITKIVKDTLNKSKLYKRISKAFPKIRVSDIFKIKN